LQLNAKVEAVTPEVLLPIVRRPWSAAASGTTAFPSKDALVRAPFASLLLIVGLTVLPPQMVRRVGSDFHSVANGSYPPSLNLGVGLGAASSLQAKQNQRRRSWGAPTLRASQQHHLSENPRFVWSFLTARLIPSFKNCGTFSKNKNWMLRNSSTSLNISENRPDCALS
jgi:hypothetical protein